MFAQSLSRRPLMSAYITQTPVHPCVLKYIFGFVEVTGVNFWDHESRPYIPVHITGSYLWKCFELALEKEVQYSSNHVLHGNASLNKVGTLKNRTGFYWQLILIFYTVLNIIKSKNKASTIHLRNKPDKSNFHVEL